VRERESDRNAGTRAADPGAFPGPIAQRLSGLDLTRGSRTREPIGEVAQPFPDGPERLGPLLAAIEHLAGVIPEGHELIAAVYDEQRQASDLLWRSRLGRVHVLFGLALHQHGHLRALRRIIGGERPSPADGAGPSAAPDAAVKPPRPITPSRWPAGGRTQASRAEDRELLAALEALAALADRLAPSVRGAGSDTLAALRAGIAAVQATMTRRVQAAGADAHPPPPGPGPPPAGGR
jgi:hypothetical protein